LEPVGVINASNPQFSASATTAAAATTTTSTTSLVGGGIPGIPGLTPVVEASRETALVLAACHSLVVVDENANKKAGSTEAGEGKQEQESKH
jgi:hypothetical protein